MTTIEYILVVIVLYFFIVFVVLRLMIPFLGFGRLALPAEIPEPVKNKIKELENTTADQHEYLAAAYNFVIERWQAGRMDTVWRAPLAFRCNLMEFWRE